MASLESFAEAGTSVSRDDDLRIIIITGGVLDIDGALDALPEDGAGWMIYCRDSGGLRSSAGASGKLGGGAMPLFIIEEDTAHRFGTDNGKSGNGANSRFAGDSTNTLIYSHIFWQVEGGTGTRSDFDVARGTQVNGSAGAGVEFNGVWLYQQASAGDRTDFNHIYSQNCKLRINERCGFGLRITHEGNGHAIIIEAQPNSQFAGLAVDDITARANNDGARVVVHLDGQTFTLDDLDTPSITESDNNQQSLLVLNNPKGTPARTADWAGYGSTMVINRDVTFNWTGASASGAVLHAVSQAASQGQDATATSGASSATIRLRTDYSAYTGNNSGGTWIDTDAYRFHMSGLSFAKYYSGPTNIAIGEDPAARSVMIAPVEFPDGTALSSRSTGSVADVSQLFEALKTFEVANPLLPAVSTRLATIGMDGTMAINGGAELVLDASASTLIARSGDVYTIKCATAGITAAKGIGLLNAGTSYAVPASTKALVKMPLRDSSGTSSAITITAHADEEAFIYKADGTLLGSNSFDADGDWTLQVPAADSAAGTAIAVCRPGYEPRRAVIDLSSGGSHAVSFDELIQELQPDLTPSYISTAGNTGIEAITFAANGQATIDIGNAAAGVREIYKAFQDAMATDAGGKFAAFGRQKLAYVLNPLAGNSLYLGADIQLRRHETGDSSAAVLAAVDGGIGGNPVNTANGEVIIKPGSDIGRIQDALLKDFDLDPTEAGTQSVAGLLVSASSRLDTIIRQGQHTATSLPLTFPEGSPLSDRAAVTGLEGQELIRDVERRAYTITPTGVSLDADLMGIHSFSGQNSHIDYSLVREVKGVQTSFTKEIIVLMQAKPTAFNETEAQPLFSIGAMLVSIAPSTGDTAALRVGVAGAQDTTAVLRKDVFNTIVFSVQQQDGNANYPIIRLSINGGAQEKWNDGSNEIYATISSSTTSFRLGARSAGNTSVGWIGDARAIFMHPDNKIFADGAGWEIPAGISWDEPFQLYKGAGLMDRTEGVAADVVEPIIEDIDAKALTEETLRNVVWESFISATPSNASNASNIQMLKWLVANVNTDAPATPAQILAEFKAETIANGITRGAKERLELAIDTGTWTLADGRITYNEGANPILAADISETARSNVAITLE